MSGKKASTVTGNISGLSRDGLLLKNWSDSPELVRTLSLMQIVTSAGDGVIEKGSDGSRVFRKFLSQVNAEDLERFVAECLDPPSRRGRRGVFDYGFILQDVVNEIGRRLDFDVTDGVYRGEKDIPGYDGLWRDGSGRDIVVEVKTTDAFSIPLDVIESYRQKLINNAEIFETSSVLFVVGRDDTGALEAQIRGSRHAWTMRMIGAASLVKLLQIKVNAEAAGVVGRIKSLFRPIEYTRLDGIVDLVFDVKVDADETTPNAEDILEVVALQSVAGRQVQHASVTAASGIETFRQKVADAVSTHLKVRLIKSKRSSFEDQNAGVRAVIAVSKRYDRGYQSYWYALYDSQRAYLEQADNSYLVLSALDSGRVWSIPFLWIGPFLADMKTTVREDGQTYWHVLTLETEGECLLIVGSRKISLMQFEIY